MWLETFKNSNSDVITSKTETKELAKNIEKNVIINETKKELTDFDYLNKSTEGLNVLKSKITGLNLPKELSDELLNNISISFYNLDDNKVKFEAIEALNKMFDYVIENKETLDWMNIYDVNELFEKYLRDSWIEDEDVLWYLVPIWGWLIIASLFAMMIAETAFIPITLFSVWLLSAVIWSIYMMWEHEEFLINKFFDSIKQIYPDITEDNWKRILELHNNWEFDMLKFKKMIDWFYSDWKLSEEENKMILEFLK